MSHTDDAIYVKKFLNEMHAVNAQDTLIKLIF